MQRLSGRWRRTRLLFGAALLCACFLPPARAEERAGVKALFHPPVALADQDGQPILTRRANGHPAVGDFNADGKPDVILGCKLNMDTAQAEVLLLENVGAQGKPAFRWPAPSLKILGGHAPVRFSCSAGCKSGGTFIIHPLDWNGDGRTDLVVNTQWKRGVLLFEHTGLPKAGPTFRPVRKLHDVRSHGKSSGGGDWNNDGIPDLVFPANRYGWSVYLGRRLAGRGHIVFDAKPALTHQGYTLVGQKGWWQHTPYAWNFSGRCPPGSKMTEVAAADAVPEDAKVSYAKKRCAITLSRLDHEKKTATLLGTVAVSRAAVTRLAIGDLNGDGSMDILYTGGVFTKGQDTHIHVLYGKVKNIPKVGAK